MDYEKPVLFDTQLNEPDPEITPMGFIVVIVVFLAGLLAIAGSVAAAVNNVGAVNGGAAANLVGHVDSLVNTVNVAVS